MGALELSNYFILFTRVDIMLINTVAGPGQSSVYAQRHKGHRLSRIGIPALLGIPNTLRPSALHESLLKKTVYFNPILNSQNNCQNNTELPNLSPHIALGHHLT